MVEAMIVRESIMNFEVGQLVSHDGREAKIIRISGNKMRLEYLDSLLFNWVDYSFLRILTVPKMRTSGSYPMPNWTEIEKQYLKDNITSSVRKLSEVLGRSEAAINTKITQLGLTHFRKIILHH